MDLAEGLMGDTAADQAAEADASIHHVQPGLLHMSLMMLLAHSHALSEQALHGDAAFADDSGGSSSSGPCADPGLGSSNSSGNMASSSSSINRDGSTQHDAASNTSHGVGHGQESSSSSGGGGSSSSSSRGTHGVDQAQQAGEGCLLSSTVWLMWQQLGLAPEALTPFTVTAYSLPSRLVDNSCILESMTKCVVASLQHMTNHSSGSRHVVSSDAACMGTYDQLSRQEQLLLLRVVWQLPVLLLQLAHLAVDCAETRDLCAAVHGTVVSLQVLRMPGLLSAGSAARHDAAASVAPACDQLQAPTAAAAAAQASDAGLLLAGSFDQLLSAMLCHWQGVMGTLLLSPPHGLLHAAAAAGTEMPEKTPCACRKTVLTSTKPPTEELRGQACVSLQCSRLDAVASLLNITQQLADAAATADALDLPPGTTGSLSSPVWCRHAPTMLLLLEALTRGVLPHQLHCDKHQVPIGSNIFKLASVPGQHLRVLLDDFVGSSSSSMLVKLCVNILQHDSMVSSAQQQCLQQQCGQQDQHQEQQPQQSRQQDHQQQPRQQGQQQRLLYVWSLTASLLKLPFRPVTGVQLITGCTTVAAVGLEAMQLIMQHAADDVSTERQRLVLAPWLALTGRCLLAQARLLRKLLAMPPPADLSPLIDAVDALDKCLVQLYEVTECWSTGFNKHSSSCSGLSSSSSTVVCLPLRLIAPASDCLQELQQQLQSDRVYAAAASQAAVAAAAAAGEAGLHVSFDSLCEVRRHVFRCPLGLMPDVGCVKVLLQAAKDRMKQLGPAASTAGSSSGGSASSSSNDTSSAGGLEQQGLSAAVVLDAVSSSKHSDEVWCCMPTLLKLQHALVGLDQLGLFLCNQLPMPWLCNNPHCTNLSGVSELQLVGGKACVCGGCRVAR
jgi:hypothetical protein